MENPEKKSTEKFVSKKISAITGAVLSGLVGTAEAGQPVLNAGDLAARQLEQESGLSSEMIQKADKLFSSINELLRVKIKKGQNHDSADSVMTELGFEMTISHYLDDAASTSGKQRSAAFDRQTLDKTASIAHNPIIKGILLKAASEARDPSNERPHF